MLNHEPVNRRVNSVSPPASGNEPDRLLTTEEAASYLNLKPETLTVWRCTKAVKLPFKKIGHAVRYSFRELQDYLEQNSHEG